MPENPNNNTFATATPITLSPTAKSFSGVLSPSDLVDIYKFTLTGSSSSIGVSLTELSNNARVRLFSETTGSPQPTQTEITGLANNPSRLSDYISRGDLTPGTYYIQVERDPNVSSATASYTLGVAGQGPAGDSINAFVDWRQQRNNVILRNQSNGTAGFWQMNGTTRAAAAGLDLPLEWQQIGIADTNGDAKTDIFWLNTVTNELAVWLMDGTTRVGSGIVGQTPKEWQIIGFDDLNGDSKTDILWRRSAAGAADDDIAVWLMDGSTRADTGVFGSIPKAWKLVGTGDFTGDRKADFLWYNDTTRQVGMWLMDGKTRIGAGVPGTLPAGWEIQGIGDTNADGRADLVLRNTSSGEAGIWLMNGATIAGTGSFGVIPLEWQIQRFGSSNNNISLADFDGNRKADMLWRNTRTGEVGFWLLDGTRLAAAGSVQLPTRWQIESGGDYNQDGKTDLALRDQTTGDTAVWTLNGTVVSGTAVVVSQLSADWQIGGGTRNAITPQPLSVSGTNFATAFNVGTLDAQGSYGDLVQQNRPDVYKFSLTNASFLTMASTPGVPPAAGVPGTTLKLYVQGADPLVAPTLTTYTQGMKLQPGTYYVEVLGAGTPDVNYALTLKGEPVAVNLTQTTEILNPTSIVLNQRANETDPTPPASNTIQVSSTFSNSGNDGVGNFNVNYYISRDNVFDPSDVLLNPQPIVVDGLGFTSGTNTKTRTNTFTLPNGENDFWSADQDYYVITRIDPDDVVRETNELDNVRLGTLPVSNTLKVDLRGFSLTLPPGTVTPTSTLQAQYQIQNIGNKALAGIVGVQFWLSRDANIDTSVAGGDLNLGFDEISSLPGARAMPAGSNVSAVKTVPVALPSKMDWSGWSNLSGLQTFYIGIVETITDADPSNNLNRGIGFDIASFTVNLG